MSPLTSEREPLLSLRRLRVVFAVALLPWAVLPLITYADPAQDVPPFVAAARVAPSKPQDVYRLDGVVYPAPAAITDASCDAFPDRAACEAHAVAFISPPLAVPLGRLGDLVGQRVAALAIRGVAAASIVIGFCLLWRLLVSRSRRAPLVLIATAAVLLPFVLRPVRLGQTSPLLFLIVCAPLDRLGRWLAAGSIGVAVALVTATKAFPVAAVGFLLLMGRRRAAAVAAVALAMLAVLSLVAYPPGLWADFVTLSRAIGRPGPAAGYNVSLGSVLSGGSLHLNEALAAAVAWVARLVAVVLAVAGWRSWGLRTRWGVLWLLLLFALPQLWDHYLWVAVGATALFVADAADPDRWIWALFAVALLTVPLGLSDQPIRPLALALLLAPALLLAVRDRFSSPKPTSRFAHT